METQRRAGERRGSPINLWPELSHQIIESAMKVHSHLGPGLLESAYEMCLCHELARRSIPFERQVPSPVRYEGLRLDCGFRIDLLVANRVVVEIKAVERLLSIHESQLLTYLKLTGHHLGLLINFNVRHLRHGICRRVNCRT